MALHADMQSPKIITGLSKVDFFDTKISGMEVYATISD